MQKLLFVILFSFLFISSFEQSAETRFKIIGHIVGLAQGEKVTISLLNTDTKQFTKLDSCLIDQEKFALSGNVPDGPKICFITFSNQVAKYAVIFIANGETMHIEGPNIAQIPNGNIRDFLMTTGSPSEKSMEGLGNVERLYIFSKRRLNRNIDSLGTDFAAIGAMIKAREILDDGLGSQLGIVMPEPYYRNFVPELLTEFDNLGLGHQRFSPFIYSQLPDSLQKSFFGRHCKKMSLLAVGQSFPSFKLPDVEKKSIDFEKIAKQNKLTVVQFWAPNSEKVEEKQKILLSAYQRYQTKGFGVVGIFCDTSARKYKIASADIPWPNVSDFKGVDGIVGNVYLEGKGRVPDTVNVLVDSQGKIIAWGISDVELKWWLWQTFDDKN